VVALWVCLVKQSIARVMLVGIAVAVLLTVMADMCGAVLYVPFSKQVGSQASDIFYEVAVDESGDVHVVGL